MYARKGENQLTGLSLPWQEEDDATVGCGWIEQTHLLGAVVARQDDVHARAGTADLLYLGVVHFADAVGEGSGGVDDALRLHRPLFLRQRVTHFGAAQDFIAIGVLLLKQFLHLNVVSDGCAMSGGGESNSQTHAGVVLLTVVIKRWRRTACRFSTLGSAQGRLA